MADNGTGSSVEFTRRFTIAGTIKKTTTFASKGGGVMIQIETGQKDKAQDLINAEGMACEFEVRVSAHKSGSEPGDEQEEELDFEDIGSGKEE